jgi:GH15 family glucan-1,4-alpha-glucosidase
LCSFWLVEVLALTGQCDEAQILFEQVLAQANDLGLLVEKMDPANQVGTSHDAPSRPNAHGPHLRYPRWACRYGLPAGKLPGQAIIHAGDRADPRAYCP